MRIFRDRGLWAVTCPASNAKLASGVAPLSEFMDMGINLAIGTDGASSNNALDMFREMYLACVLQKLRREDAAACPAGDILYAACSGGARAMGLPDCDSLAPGKWADLAVIDLSRPSMRPILAPAQNLVYSCLLYTSPAALVHLLARHGQKIGPVYHSSSPPYQPLTPLCFTK